MRILGVNPNSSIEMTGHIRSVLERIKSPGTELTVVHTAGAPRGIGSARDVAQAVPPMLEVICKANEEKYDAAIIACFADPGLEAAREVSDILVLGIEETTLHVAAMLGHKFTILTPLVKRIPTKYREVRRFGLENVLASVRGVGVTVAETCGKPERVKARILEVAHRAVDEDGAEVIVLGCAGMAGYAGDLEKELGVTVLDPSAVTLKICEALVDIRVCQSKKGFYITPPL